METGRRTAAQVAGGEGEDAATALLVGNGMRIVARNYRTRFGEVDIVARDGESLVFVEVRLRADSRFGGAAGSIGTRKRARIAAAAREFLRQTRSNLPCRFDVVTIEAGEPRWLRAAFEMDY
ncbi:MAG TPA: YraN family protein [Usitatibacter sp.]|jgi:putative endonuclease|nr:YraN family protein [Usitatibacter sp.]